MTYFNSASTPADGAAAANAGPNATITPPGSMVAGDRVIVVVQYRGNVTMSVSQAGGQTWTNMIGSTNSGNVTLAIFECVFNGTWSANPTFTNTSGTNALTAVMHVFRPSAGSSFRIDPTSATATSPFSAPSTPFDVTASASGGTLRDSVLWFLVWASDDDNTWSLQTAGWNTAGTAQYRNTTGQDQSNSSAYKIFTAPPSTANVVNRQATLGGDPGIWIFVEFYETPIFQALNLSVSHPTPVAFPKIVSV